MSHRCRVALLLFFVLGCALPAERVPLKPIPDDGTPQAYSDLIDRARAQASSANEAFYVKNWADLEIAARGLVSTAQYLPKATQVPALHKDKLPIEAGDLGKEAERLRAAASAKEIKPATEALQRVNLLVRELHPDPTP